MKYLNGVNHKYKVGQHIKFMDRVQSGEPGIREGWIQEINEFGNLWVSITQKSKILISVLPKEVV